MMQRALKQSRAHATRELISQRQKAAFDIKPEWERYASPQLIDLVAQYSSSVGCPREFMFFPLLTATAAMLGRNTTIKITDMWSEPAILWCIIAARKGEKKSAAMRIISKAVWKTESDAQELFFQQHPEYLPKEEGEELSEEALQARPVFSMTNSQFTFSKLHDQMSKNDGECLLLYDEIAALYDQLDHQGSGSQCDRKILLSLYGGDPWSRSSKSCGTNTMEATHFNYTGFMQPTIAINMLSVDDYDGFNDRHVAIVCPERSKLYFDDLQPISPELPALSTILTLIRRLHHDNHRTYVLDEEASAAFKDSYNNLEDRMEEFSDNEDHRGVLSKAQGQTARLALVLHVLNNAVQQHDVAYADYVTPLSIPVGVMNAAISLMDFCINQKFALMPPCGNGNEEVSQMYSFERVWETHPRNVRSLLESDPDEVDASYVAQRRLIPPQKTPNSTNRYPVAAAKAYLNVLAEAGLGSIVQPTNCQGKRRSSTVLFRKRKLDDMSADAKSILDTLQIDENEYGLKVGRKLDEN